MKKANLAISILGILFAGYVIHTASGFPQNQSAVEPGPAYFPTMMGYLMIALCVILLVISLISKEKSEKFVITADTRRVAVGVVIFVVYCALFKTLGFILDTIWFCFACMLLLQNKRYVLMGITSIVSAVVIYFVFATLLGAKLPAGLLKGIL